MADAGRRGTAGFAEQRVAGNACAIGFFRLCEHDCTYRGQMFKFTDKMLAHCDISRHDDFDTSEWKVCQAFYDLVGRDARAPPKQCVLCSRQANSAGKLSILTDQNVFVRARLAGCKIGALICKGCRNKRDLKAEADSKLAAAATPAGLAALEAEAEAGAVLEPEAEVTTPESMRELMFGGTAGGAGRLMGSPGT